MSIFLAVNTTGAPNTLFSERGLNNLAAAKLSEVGAITMRSGPRVVQQDLVFGHLAQFLSASGDPHHAYAPADMYPVGPHLSRDFVAPVEYPIVQVVGASSAQVEEMLSFGMEQVTGRGKASCVGRVTLEQARTIKSYGLDSKNMNLAPGHIGIDAWLAFNTVWKFLAATARLTWIGYNPDGTRNPETALVLGGPRNDDNGCEGPSGVWYFLDGTTRTGCEAIDFKKVHVDEDVGELVVIKGDVYPVGVAMGKDGLEIEKAFVSPARVMDHFTQGGHIFPYFDRLINGSKEFLQPFLTEIIAPCCTTNPEALPKILDAIRVGIRQFTNTFPGMVVSHAAYGLYLARMSHSPLKYVVDAGGSYKGFMIGKDCVVIMRNAILKPLSEPDLRKEVLALDSHNLTLTAIFDSIDATQAMKENPRYIDRQHCRTSARNFANVLMTYNAEILAMPDDDRKEFDRLIERLSFNRFFWKPTPDKMLILLRAISSGTWPPENLDAPFFLRKGTAYSTDPIVRFLAAFGPSAPTIAVSDGEISKVIPSRSAAQDPNLVLDKDGKRSMPFIPVYLRPINQAASEWRWVAANGRIKFYQPRKKVEEYTNANKKADSIGGFNFERFYSLLKDWVDGERKKNAAAPRGVKRRMDEPAGEDDEAKKRRKEMEAASSEAASFFL